MQLGGYEIQVPFVTTSTDHIKAILSLAKITQGENLADLGSGDGRMVLEFAKLGSFVRGYEINTELVKRSKKRIQDVGLTKNAVIYQKSFWDIDLSPYDLIYIYGMQSILGRLEKKLESEMKPGARFISNIFRLPRWNIKRTKDDVYLYIKQ